MIIRADIPGLGVTLLDANRVTKVSDSVLEIDAMRGKMIMHVKTDDADRLLDELFETGRLDLHGLEFDHVYY